MIAVAKSAKLKGSMAHYKMRGRLDSIIDPKDDGGQSREKDRQKFFSLQEDYQKYKNDYAKNIVFEPSFVNLSKKF